MPNNSSPVPQAPERVTLPDGIEFVHNGSEWYYSTVNGEKDTLWPIGEFTLPARRIILHLLDALLVTQRALAAAQQDRDRVTRLEELIDSMAVEDLLSEIGDRWFALAAHGKANLRAAIDATLSASSGAARGAGAALADLPASERCDGDAVFRCSCRDEPTKSLLRDVAQLLRAVPVAVPPPPAAEETDGGLRERRLREIAERAERATPEPWEAGRADMATVVDGVDSKWIYGPNGEYVALASGLVPLPGKWFKTPAGRVIQSPPIGSYAESSRAAWWNAVMANAAFIAHARADIPWLLAEVRRLQSLLSPNAAPAPTPQQEEPER